MNKTDKEKLFYEGITKVHDKKESKIKTINNCAKRITGKLKLDEKLQNITQ